MMTTVAAAAADHDKTGGKNGGARRAPQARLSISPQARPREAGQVKCKTTTRRARTSWNEPIRSGRPHLAARSPAAGDPRPRALRYVSAHAGVPGADARCAPPFAAVTTD